MQWRFMRVTLDEMTFDEMDSELRHWQRRD